MITRWDDSNVETINLQICCFIFSFVSESFNWQALNECPEVIHRVGLLEVLKVEGDGEATPTFMLNGSDGVVCVLLLGR